MQVNLGTEEYPEDFERNACQQLREKNDKSIMAAANLGAWVVEVVDDSHKPRRKTVERILAVLIEEEQTIAVLRFAELLDLTQEVCL